MALELQVPPLIDFDFSTGRGSPSIDARPLTPKRFGEVCCSAPASPARDYTINDGFDYELGDWDERIWCFSSPKRVNNSTFSSSSESPNDGKLKTKSPIFGGTRGRVDETEAIKGPLLSPNNIPNSRRKKSFWSTFSPKRKKEIEFNPFEDVEKGETRTKQMRGRGRESGLPALRSGRRATRSLSPLRGSKYLWEDQEEEKVPRNTNQSSSSSSVTKPPLPLKGSRKWRLKDFLLFRSASEGRTSEKDPFRKYAEMYRKQVARSSGSKSTDEFGSGVIPSPRRGQISAHELHYTVNKAISQDMKKKSFLPYKQGILGRLAVNPAAHALAYGFGSVPNNYS